MPTELQEGQVHIFPEAERPPTYRPDADIRAKHDQFEAEFPNATHYLYHPFSKTIWAVSNGTHETMADLFKEKSPWPGHEAYEFAIDSMDRIKRQYPK